MSRDHSLVLSVLCQSTATQTFLQILRLLDITFISERKCNIINVNTSKIEIKGQAVTLIKFGITHQASNISPNVFTNAKMDTVYKMFYQQVTFQMKKRAKSIIKKNNSTRNKHALTKLL